MSVNAIDILQSHYHHLHFFYTNKYIEFPLVEKLSALQSNIIAL